MVVSGYLAELPYHFAAGGKEHMGCYRTETLYRTAFRVCGGICYRGVALAGVGGAHFGCEAGFVVAFCIVHGLSYGAVPV